jgi:choline-sulfatase
MSCAGRNLVPTPNLDQLALSGIRFENAYCPSPSCVPARMSLLTGLYPRHHGALTNMDRLDWRYRTIAHQFSAAGYLTGLIGKMHFNDAQKHGFDYYLSINDWLMYLGPKVRHFANEIANHPLVPGFFDRVIDDGAGLPDIADLWDGPSPWVGEVERSKFENMESLLPEQDHLDMFVAREATKFLKRYRGQPFFLIASFMKPHSPFFSPKKWAAQYPIEREVLPEIGDISTYPDHLRRRIAAEQAFPEHLRKAHQAGYHANLAFADYCIGHLLHAVQELSLQEETLIVYTSDHGEMDGDHGLYQKFCLFEPAVKVPLIFSWKGHLSSNTTAKGLTEWIGLYPTLCALAGIPEPTNITINDWKEGHLSMDGKSFASQVWDPLSDGASAVFAETPIQRSEVRAWMIRTGHWKYIWNEGGACDELYDLSVDPREHHNLVSSPAHAAVINKLKQHLQNQLIQS